MRYGRRRRRCRSRNMVLHHEVRLLKDLLCMNPFGPYYNGYYGYGYGLGLGYGYNHGHGHGYGYGYGYGCGYGSYF